MERYDPKRVVARIEQLLAEPDTELEAGSAASGLPEGEAPPRALPAASEARAQSADPVIREAERGYLRELHYHSSVDRPVAGTRMAWLKRAMLLAVRPMARRQAAFNHRTVDALRELSGQLDDLCRGIESGGGYLRPVWSGLEDLGHRLEQVRREMLDGRESIWEAHAERVRRLEELSATVAGIETRLGELRARVLTIGEQQAILLNEAEKETGGKEPRRTSGSGPRAERREGPVSGLVQQQLDLAYLRFQRQFRGDEKELERRQREYVPVLERLMESEKGDGEKPRVLDLACGDGIFAGLLEEEGFEAVGVDINSAMVEQGRRRGAPVREGDAFAFLAESKDGEWDAVTAFQFVEHLRPAELMELLRQCFRVLRPGGIVVLETLNPHTLMAHKWFQLDLSHERLVFPEMLQLLMETVGFRHLETQGLNPVAEHERLSPVGDDAERGNIERLNEVLFGPQDYYIAGRRPA